MNEPPRLESLRFTIRTRDLEKARWFYEEVLGLARVEEWDDASDRGLILRVAPDAFIEISDVRPHDESHRAEFEDTMSTDKVDIQLRADSVDSWARRLEDAEWPCRGPVDRPWGARYLYLRDPDGVKIIIYQSVG